MMLRKLTRLSKIDFGYHAGKTVEQILNCRTGHNYMKWLYFNASHIDLCDSLINELKINHILIKPGKDPQIWEQEYYQDPRLPKNKSLIALDKMIPKTNLTSKRTYLQYKNRTTY